jgi:hypothetical protein
MRKVVTALAAVLLLGMSACKDCKKLEAAKIAACQFDPQGELCKQLTSEFDNSCTVQPTPTPSPIPTPEPTPEPTPTPTPVPTPTPTPTPNPSVCTVPLDGSYVMGAYLLYPRVVDSTPKITNAERCKLVGMPDRITCPVTAEGDPQRYVCEVELMGGPKPVYEIVVDSGNLQWSYEDDWKARISGNGKGRIRSCYPNGKACSKWVELSY